MLDHSLARLTLRNRVFTLGLRHTLAFCSSRDHLVQFLVIQHLSVPLGTGIVKTFRCRTQSTLMLPVRFSLRTLIATVAVVASLLAVAPTLHCWYVWAPYRESLDEWAASLKRLPNKCESKTVQLPSGNWVGVSTAELDVADDYSTAGYSGQPVRDRGYFVIPLGKWVDTIPDVVRTWHKHSR